MENENVADIRNLIAKSDGYEKRKELVGTIPITGIIKKIGESQDSFILTGYDVDDICPPPRPRPWPPRRRDAFGPGPTPQPWIQKGIKIDVKDVIHHEIINKSESRENIVRVFINDHASIEVTIGIRSLDLVSIGPKQEDLVSIGPKQELARLNPQPLPP